MRREVLVPAWAPDLVAMSAVTVAVLEGTSAGFRPAATHRRADELLRDLEQVLHAAGVADLGAASVSVLAATDAGVGVQIGIVVPDGVELADVRTVLRPAHRAATLLVRGDQDEQSWAGLRSWAGEARLTPLRRPYAVFQHPRPLDRRARVTQLVLPVAGPDGT